MIIYELHIGTFTPEGTFDAIIPRLKDLRELGVNAIKLMPVAQFPGKCNWGYDGVYPFAVQNSYGGCKGLKRLVDACHQHSIAVILDVVYNHNRMLGERLTQLVSFEALKLAAGAVILSPYIPVLFMGEEYGKSALFVYFVNHE